MNIKYKDVKTAIWSRKEGLSFSCFFCPWNSLKIDWPCTVCVFVNKQRFCWSREGRELLSIVSLPEDECLSSPSRGTNLALLVADGSCSDKTLWVIFFILFSFSYIPRLYLPSLNYGFSLTTHLYFFMTDHPRFFPCTTPVHSWIHCFVFASTNLLAVLRLYLSCFILSWQPPNSSRSLH